MGVLNQVMGALNQVGKIMGVLNQAKSIIMSPDFYP